MNFICLPFCELSAIQLYEILHLRSEVFVLEQTCVYQDIDYKDMKQDVHHLMMRDNDTLIGYARLLPADISYPTPSIGRILTCPSARNKGLGRRVIKAALDRTYSLCPKHSVTIGSQSHLSSLYHSFVFT